MGEGCTDLSGFFDLFENRCPGVTVNIERISGFPKPLACFDRDFWRVYPAARAEDFAGFLALAKRGRPLEPFRPPEAGDKTEATRRHQLDELARSIHHCREVLGLGLRGLNRPVVPARHPARHGRDPDSRPIRPPSGKIRMSIHWLYLAIAIVAEVVGTSFLKATEGFSQPLPSLAVMASYGLAFFFLCSGGLRPSSPSAFPCSGGL